MLLSSSKPKHSPSLYKRGAVWLAFLGPFFFLTYGFTNQFTSTRSDVGVIVADWEHYLPFVPWLMLPYMSIDAFYAVSLFLFRKRRQLDRHAIRLLMATVISIIGFLLFPLKFSFDVPRATGFNGFLQTVLLGFDKPYNQAPSLHISLLIILWVLYAKKLTGFWRLMLHAWFLAIGVSVLLVFQHHFIDIWTGALVGLAILYIVPEMPHTWRWTQPTKTSVNIGLYYLFGSSISGLIGYQLTPMIAYFSAFFWWLSLALLLVAAAYFGLNQHVFQRQTTKKNAGIMSWPAKLLLAPYLLASYISYRFYTRNISPISQITAQVYLGSFPKNFLDYQQFVTVLDLTNEFSQPALPQAHNHLIPMLDLVPPSPNCLAKATYWLQNKIQKNEVVLVHCALGLSRSASVVVCWLVWADHAKNVEDAINQVAAKRAGIVLSKEHIKNIEIALQQLN